MIKSLSWFMIKRLEGWFLDTLKAIGMKERKAQQLWVSVGSKLGNLNRLNVEPFPHKKLERLKETTSFVTNQNNLTYHTGSVVPPRTYDSLLASNNPLMNH